MSRRAPREEPTATFAALSPIYWTLAPYLTPLFVVGFFILFVLLKGSPHADAGVFGYGLIALYVALFGLAYIGSTVTLAEGGLWIKHYGGIFKRFIPYSEISFVDTIQRLGKPMRRSNFEPAANFIIFHAVRLRLKNGKRVVIGTARERLELSGMTSWALGQYGHFGGAHATARELMGEIRTRVRAQEELPAPTREEEALMRGERTIAEWRAALRERVPETEDAYRGAGAAETLWRVIEDEDAPRDARAGAAIALREQLDADGRARLRVVAESCASPKLRVALDAALDENAEEESVLAALERVSNRTE